MNNVSFVVGDAVSVELDQGYWPGYEYMARLIRTILPQITRFGVATEEDVGIDTLADRLRAEIGDDGAAVTWGFITAWAPHQARP